MASRIIAEVDFNRDDERAKFGCYDRIVNICCVGDITSLSFAVTNKEDSVMSLMFETDELSKRFSEACRTRD